MNIAMVTPEVVPFSKTGGLGDVVGALPHALEKLGHDVVVFSPLYSMVRSSAEQLGIALEESPAGTISVQVGDFEVKGRVMQASMPGTQATAYFLENDAYYDRPGLYVSPADGTDYQDNSERFIFFCRGVLEACKAMGLVPDVFHCHDWQTGLIPVYLKHLYQDDFPRSASVFTVHNVAYQGLFWHWDMKLTGLPWELFNWRMLEYYGNLSFLKAGLVGADKLTTVSKKYAEEIQTEKYGLGLEGVFRDRVDDLTGIVNGVDYTVWSPESDPALPANYSAEDLSGKAACKKALQEAFNLPQEADVPVMGMIGRLVNQKGLDLLTEALPNLMDEPLQLVVLGTGERLYHDLLEQATGRYPDKVGARLDFDESLAHLIEAGSDLFLMPSRFEPCGLNQLYSMKYGTVVVVSETGGLADTVSDYGPEDGPGAQGSTGFVFPPDDVKGMTTAIKRALRLYREGSEKWRALMLRGMSQDWSWERSARQYVEVYAGARKSD